jgi:branched-chain amino acid transport system ATP-binding protein
MTADSSTAQHLFDGVPFEPGAAKNDPILVADGVRRAFGGLVAVDVEHLEVQRGAITALIGPNGAGKTTFFNLLTNFDEPDTGSRLFEGNDLSGVSAYKVANLGMVRTFQLTNRCQK